MKKKQVSSYVTPMREAVDRIIAEQSALSADDKQALSELADRAEAQYHAENRARSAQEESERSEKWAKRCQAELETKRQEIYVEHQKNTERLFAEARDARDLQNMALAEVAGMRKFVEHLGAEIKSYIEKSARATGEAEALGHVLYLRGLPHDDAQLVAGIAGTPPEHLMTLVDAALDVAPKGAEFVAQCEAGNAVMRAALEAEVEAVAGFKSGPSALSQAALETGAGKQLLGEYRMLRDLFESYSAEVVGTVGDGLGFCGIDNSSGPLPVFERDPQRWARWRDVHREKIVALARQLNL